MGLGILVTELTKPYRPFAAGSFAPALCLVQELSE